DTGKGTLTKEQEQVTKDTRQLAEIIRKRYGDKTAPGKRVDRAAEHERRAGKQLEGDKPSDAESEIGKAIDDLEEAGRLFREQHDHCQHEHRDLLREKLLGHLRQMLAVQSEVRDATVKLDQEAESANLSRADQQRALKLADQEGTVHQEAKDMVQLLL